MAIRLTESKLRQIIREEINSLNESYGADHGPATSWQKFLKPFKQLKAGDLVRLTTTGEVGTVVQPAQEHVYPRNCSVMVDGRRQVVHVDDLELADRSMGNLSEMAPTPAGQVVVAIYAGPDGAELELNDADDGSDEALQVREDFELDSMDAESPGGFGLALKKVIPKLKRLGATHVSFSVGDSDPTPVPLDTAAPVLTRLVRQAMRGNY